MNPKVGCEIKFICSIKCASDAFALQTNLLINGQQIQITSEHPLIWNIFHSFSTQFADNKWHAGTMPSLNSECCVRKSFHKTIYSRINVSSSNAVRVVMALHLFYPRSLFNSIDFATVSQLNNERTMQNGWLSASLTFLFSKEMPLFSISSSSLRTSLFPFFA